MKRRFQVMLDPRTAEKLRQHGQGNLSIGIAKAAEHPGVGPKRRKLTPEEFRKEEARAIERERSAFERRQKAFLNVHRQFVPLGNGQPTEASLSELDLADREWKLAKDDIERIVQEIRAGVR